MEGEWAETSLMTLFDPKALQSGRLKTASEDCQRLVMRLQSCHASNGVWLHFSSSQMDVKSWISWSVYRLWRKDHLFIPLFWVPTLQQMFPAVKVMSASDTHDYCLPLLSQPEPKPMFLTTQPHLDQPKWPPSQTSTLLKVLFLATKSYKYALCLKVICHHLGWSLV